MAQAPRREAPRWPERVAGRVEDLDVREQRRADLGVGASSFVRVADTADDEHPTIGQRRDPVHRPADGEWSRLHQFSALWVPHQRGTEEALHPVLVHARATDDEHATVGEPRGRMEDAPESE